MKSILFTALFGWLFANPLAPATEGDTKLYLPDDLEATLWAESPMFYNPTNMDVDARGRIWVTEAVDYRDFNNKPDTHLHHPKGERVMILEDTNHDGRADKSSVFVQDTALISPLGIAVLGNKVYVSAAPNLICYTDDNGDDKADRKEVFLTGFGGKDHDHSLHAVVAGPDGKYYFNTGNAGPHVVTDKSGWTLRSGSLYVGGTPYNTINHGNMTSDDGRVWVGGLALRINADGTGLRVMGHNFRNNYETCLDSYGSLWQNDNDDQVVTCRTSFLMEGANAGYFSQDGTRYWQADQRPGQSIATAHWHQQDPGVMPYGDLTGAGSPTGIAFYEGDALGPNYRGMLLSCEAGRNVIYGYKPELQGAGYQLDRQHFISTFATDEPDYKWNKTETDTRKWFRPSDVAVGTDGALYIADWYDPIVGGHAMHDKKGYGRIYRITPKGKNPTSPKLDLSRTKGQIDALCNPATNVRMLGFAALAAQGETVIEPVQKLLTHPNPFVRARAVWLLTNLGPEGRKQAQTVLTNADPNLRITALRALRQKAQDPMAVMDLVRPLTNDPASAARREAAIALRDVPYRFSKSALLKLIEGYDGQDRYYLTALGIGATDKQDALFADLQVIIPKDPAHWETRTANLIWELHPAAAVDLFRQRAAGQSLTADARAQALTGLAFIKTTGAANAMIALAQQSGDTALARNARYWVDFRRGNDWATLVNWDEALPEKRTANEAKIADLRQKLLDEYVSEADKTKVALDMARDPDGGKTLVGLAADKKLSETLKKAIGTVIFENPDQTVRTMAGDYFPKAETDKTLSVGQITALSGDGVNGLAVFKANCANCHKHGAMGADIGPNLTAIHQKLDRNTLLDAIINPSAGLAFGYEPWLITTKTGQTYYGFLLSDGAQSVILKDVAGQKHTIATAKIASRKQYNTSLMPDPVSMGLNEQQLADLTSYLLKQ